MTEITNLKIDMAELKKDISFIKEHLLLNDEKHKELETIIREGFLSMDKKYAPRILWTISVWVGAIVGSTMIIGLLGLIAKAIIKESL
jgi:hypothetical protein